MSQELAKAYAITNARISFVSLVDKAANLRKFLLTKADDGTATFSTCGRILKADPKNHHVTGVVYEPMAEDSQGNYMTEEEITKAAHWFVKNSGKVDIQHSFEAFKGATVVESWIAKADFSIGEEPVKKGTWLLTVEIDDPDVWAAIEKGDITGFSMGGVGNYSKEDVDLSKQQGSVEPPTADTVKKGAVADLYGERSKGVLFWEAFHALQDVLCLRSPTADRLIYETEPGKLRECLEDFNNIITSILTGGEDVAKTIESGQPLEKAGKKMSGRNRDTLHGIYESLGAFLKEFDDPEEDPEKKQEGQESDPEDPKNPASKKEDKGVNKQELSQFITAAVAKALGTAAPQESQDAPADITESSIQKMVEEAVKKATAPQDQPVSMEQVQGMINAAVAKSLEPVLRSRGLPSNLGTPTVEKQEQHYLHGLL